MKSLRNKVILSGIVLLFAFMATVGSTYAWFTVSSSAEVEEMTLNVTAADNLLIRVNDGVPTTGSLAYLQDPNNYGTSISAADLVNFLETGGVANRLQPSTVLHNLAGGEYLGYVNNYGTAGFASTGPTYAAATENDVNGHYIKLEFWVLSQSENDKGIELSQFSIAAGENTYAEQDEISEAVRLAVVMEDASYGDYTNASPTGAGSEFIFGNDDGIDGLAADGTYGFVYASTAPAYNYTAPAQTGFTVNTDVTVGTIYTLEFNEPTLVTAYIFIEGWDAAASNNVVLAEFDISFGFKYTE